MYKYLLLYQKGYEQNAHIPFTIIMFHVHNYNVFAKKRYQNLYISYILYIFATKF